MHAIIPTVSSEPAAKGRVWNGLSNQPCRVFGCKRLMWICYPGHAGVSGNERADRLASTADITSSLHLGRAEVFGGWRNFLNMNRPEHHSIDHQNERGWRKEAADIPPSKGRERAVFRQTNTATASKETLGTLLRDRIEYVWAFPSATKPS